MRKGKIDGASTTITTAVRNDERRISNGKFLRFSPYKRRKELEKGKDGEKERKKNFCISSNSIEYFCEFRISCKSSVQFALRGASRIERPATWRYQLWLLVNWFLKKNARANSITSCVLAFHKIAIRIRPSSTQVFAFSGCHPNK